ncbi:MAG: hypothetical protein EYC71_00595 [Gammaproteobacteria bacterium]|nr:MAG: hypothetical protein EYC71_00595 [Gammaproteobacteria bacterium]
MKYLSFLIAFILLAFAANDALYVATSWGDFRPFDVARHFGFQASAVLLVVWHVFLTWRAWLYRQHGKLLMAFLCLAALDMTFFGYLPALHHAITVEDTSWQSLIVVGIMLVLAFILIGWAWRLSGAPNNSSRRRFAARLDSDVACTNSRFRT